MYNYDDSFLYLVTLTVGLTQDNEQDAPSIHCFSYHTLMCSFTHTSFFLHIYSTSFLPNSPPHNYVSSIVSKTITYQLQKLL